MFTLHTQLQQDCVQLGRFELCHLLLMNDANYPWFILVPGREDITEIFQLSEADQIQLIRESSVLSEKLAWEFKADKMNIGALGNMVPQLHVHHIVRYQHDPAWPAPVWGKLAAKPYEPVQLQQLLDRLKNLLTSDFVFREQGV